MSMTDPGWGPTRQVTRNWLIVLGLIVAIPYGIVWGLSGWNYAFDVLTGTASAFHPDVGPAGEVLAVVGWLLIPVVVGAIAAVWFSLRVRKVFGTELGRQVLGEMRAVAEADAAGRSRPRAVAADGGGGGAASGDGGGGGTATPVPPV
jgi:hypothetical protein